MLLNLQNYVIVILIFLATALDSPFFPHPKIGYLYLSLMPLLSLMLYLITKPNLKKGVRKERKSEIENESVRSDRE